MYYNFENCPNNKQLTKFKGNFFVLLFMGRTGSSFTLDVLNQHPKIKFEGEWLGTFKDKSDASQLQTNWIKELFGTENKTAYQAIGFKTKHFDIFDEDAFLKSLGEFRPTILFSQRRNLLKQSISAVRINQRAELKRQSMSNDTWQQQRYGNRLWNIFEKGEGLGKTKVDIEEVNNQLLWLEEYTDKIIDFVAHLDKDLGLDVVAYDYEDLIANPDLFFSNLFNLMGVEKIPYKTKIFKHTSDNLVEVIENFDELQSYYKRTRFEQFLY